MLPEHKCCKGDWKTCVLGAQWHAWTLPGTTHGLCVHHLWPRWRLARSDNPPLFTRVVQQGARPERSPSMGIRGFVPFCPWYWCLLLATLQCCGASSELNRSTDSSARRELNVRYAAASSQPAETISVFTLDYDYVQIPYEVTLWILLASLAKIGKAPSVLAGLGSCFLCEIMCMKMPCRWWVKWILTIAALR